MAGVGESIGYEGWLGEEVNQNQPRLVTNLQDLQVYVQQASKIKRMNATNFPKIK